MAKADNKKTSKFTRFRRKIREEVSILKVGVSFGVLSMTDFMQKQWMKDVGTNKNQAEPPMEDKSYAAGLCMEYNRMAMETEKPKDFIKEIKKNTLPAKGESITTQAIDQKLAVIQANNTAALQFMTGGTEFGRKDISIDNIHSKVINLKKDIVNVTLISEDQDKKVGGNILSIRTLPNGKYRIFDPNFGESGDLSEKQLKSALNNIIKYYQDRSKSRYGKDNIQSVHVMDGAELYTKTQQQALDTRLLEAVKNNKSNFTISELLTNDANVNVTDDQKMTPLMYAAKNNDTEVIKMLIDKDATVNAKDKEGRTALMHAAKNGNKELTETLIDKNLSSIDAIDNNGMTPLMHAAKNGNKELTETLIDKNLSSINAIDNNGMTPLMHAMASNNVELTYFLINSGNDINSKDKNGKTPLMHAIANNKLDMVEELIKMYKIDLDLKDNDGKTALDHLTAKETMAVGQYNLANKLIEKGATATPDIKDNLEQFKTKQLAKSTESKAFANQVSPNVELVEEVTKPRSFGQKAKDVLGVGKK